LKKKKKVKKN